MSPTILTDKIEATRLADALRRCADIDFDGDFGAAAALLERWPDAVEPVARVSWNDIGHISWRTNVMLPDGTPLYTAPPDQSERIAALEADRAAALRLANDLTLETQTVEEAVADLVRMVRDARTRIAALEASLAERDRVIEQARMALEDMNNGWKYIRRAHGDLYGVGWDRAEGKADAALRAIEEAQR